MAQRCDTCGGLYCGCKILDAELGYSFLIGSIAIIGIGVFIYSLVLLILN